MNITVNELNNLYEIFGMTVDVNDGQIVGVEFEEAE